MRSTVTSIDGRDPGIPNDQDIRTFGDEKLAVLYRQTGDERYYAELYGRYQRWLVEFLSRYAQDRPELDLEGISNVVFVDLRDYCRSGERLQSIRAWLAVRAKHRVQDDIRYFARQKRGGELRQQGLNEHITDTRQENPARALVRVELWNCVQEAMTGLSKGEQDVFSLMYYGGLSCQETAERLGIPEGTVKSRLNHGLTLLRRNLREAISN
jgi:RNA polymerase sigma-70 factor (ECF subfamily)